MINEMSEYDNNLPRWFVELTNCNWEYEAEFYDASTPLFSKNIIIYYPKGEGKN